MTKRLYILLVITIALFLGARTFHSYLLKQATFEKYAQVIEQYLYEQEEQVAGFMESQAFRNIRSGKPAYPPNPRSVEQHKQLAKALYTLTLFSGDSLVFWNNNRILPSEEVLRSYGDTTTFLRLDNGFYLLKKSSVAPCQFPACSAIALIPLKYYYQLESDYLKNRFVADDHIPQSLQLSTIPTRFAVHTLDKKATIYLAGEAGLAKDYNYQLLVFLSYLLAFLALGFFLHHAACRIAESNLHWLGAAFLIFFVLVIRFLTLVFGTSESLDQLALFNIPFEIPFNKTLGDFLINIVLLLWIMFFLHRSAGKEQLRRLPRLSRHLLAFINYLSIVLGLLFVSATLKSLVLQTSINFEFESVFDLDQYSLLVILGVIMLLTALFLFGHRLILGIQQMEISRTWRWIFVGLVSALSFPLILFLELPLGPEYMLLMVFLLLVTFELFIQSSHLNFMWLILWMVILSIIPSFLLFKFNGHKDRLLRLDYVKELSRLRDPAAESSIDQFIERVAEDPQINAIAAKPFGHPIDKDSLEQRLDQLLRNNSYLHYNYDYNVYVFHRFGAKALRIQRVSFATLNRIYDSSDSTAYPGLYFNTASRRQPFYWQQLNLELDNPIYMFFEFRRNRKERSKVYTELLVDKPYRGLDKIGNYDFAIYNARNRLIDNEGRFSENFNTDKPPKGESSVLLENGFSYLIYHAPSDLVVVVSKKQETILKGVSLFSFFFAILVLTTLLIAGVNTLVRILPDTLNLSLTGRPSLRRRIQLTIVTLTVIFFIFIGIVTVQFFQDSTDRYHNDRLGRKTEAILTDAEYELDRMDLSKGWNLENLAHVVQPLSRIHHMDINLYDLTGKLVRSSEEDLFRRGVLSEQISPVAFHAITQADYSNFSGDERIGDLKYKTAYVPLRIRLGRRDLPVGYLGLPYYSKQRQLRSEVNVFMGTLLNVYVFLVLIASGLSVFVANSITRGVTKIGEKLKELKLGDRNEPLEWKSKDELGDLISEYNKMIVKLEESAERLAQSEREVAWREMAKQVAHEIKNPLTPMKLSIQYLMHAYKGRSEDVEPLLKRVTGTLIEQIENLSQIAAEFSTFAKMPKPDNQEVLLNQLVETVYDLFSERNDMDVNLTLPNKDLLVYADKNQLISVLNNLLKNAIQAIPDNRRGRIEVALTQEGDKALIAVKDNGSGISKDMRDKVFVPNFTTKSSGTGLGLAISKNIIESASGNIFFETEIGAGTTFFVELPLMEVDMPAISLKQ